MDEDGCLYFIGRSDDIIKTRGEKVSPVEVENCLHGIPGVREAAVIGVPDELFGEAVKAFVALERGAALTDREIRAVCTAKLENFAVPKEIVFLDELPKTSTGKIRKKDLA
jgi:acyl-coenzyme A synthetase/AMP-(fatty) acid ligase